MSGIWSSVSIGASLKNRVNIVELYYKMNSLSLERCQSIKDLGVMIDKNLNWNAHINGIVNKANRMISLIMRTLGYSAPTSVSNQLYTTLVSSTLEYCCSASNGKSPTKCHKI